VARGLDHVVIAVRDLEAAARGWESLGFTLTPTARHPWGTANRLVQLPGFFLEILTVADPAQIFERSGSRYSFGAFNRDFLIAGEGASMLVLEGRDADADLVDFAAGGWPAFERFDFEREARQPDGAVRKVAFSLAFTEAAGAPRTGFFTCQQHFPENFWKPTFQTHANGATGIAAVVAVCEAPSDHAAFLRGFSGSGDVEVAPDQVVVSTPRGRIEVLAQQRYRRLYGPEPAGQGLRLGALVLTSVNPEGALALARRNGLPVDLHAQGSIVRARALNGVAVRFEKDRS
jgi:hypothetical protein